jgi:predicted glycosyltransferase
MVEEASITPQAVAAGIEAALVQRGSADLDLQMDGARETARLLRVQLSQSD